MSARLRWTIPVRFRQRIIPGSSTTLNGWHSVTSFPSIRNHEEVAPNSALLTDAFSALRCACGAAKRER